MSSKKKKYYVVWQGYMPGIYESWSECKQQVQAYPNAQYKSFSSREEAEEAFAAGPGYAQSNKQKASSPKNKKVPDEVIASNPLTVDAACSGNPGIMEYRAVWLNTGVEEFRKGPFQRGTNNIGEFLAIIHAAAQLQKLNDSSTPIYTDSRTALAWIRKKKVNTKLRFDAKNKRLKNLIDRAESWLQKNEITNPLKKWDTAHWGEIPADFGRK